MKSYQTQKCRSLEELHSSLRKNLEQQFSKFDKILLCFQGKSSDDNAASVKHFALVLQDKIIHLASFDVLEGYLGNSISLKNLKKVEKEKVALGHTLHFHELNADPQVGVLNSFTSTSLADAEAFQSRVEELAKVLGKAE